MEWVLLEVRVACGGRWANGYNYGIEDSWGGGGGCYVVGCGDINMGVRVWFGCVRGAWDEKMV
jgi:hypothetical protein